MCLKDQFLISLTQEPFLVLLIKEPGLVQLTKHVAAFFIWSTIAVTRF